MFTSSSNLVILSSSHLHIFTSSHLHIFTSSHLHICNVSHIFSSSHLHIFTSAIFLTYFHLHIFSSSHLLSLPFFLSLSLCFSLALLPSVTVSILLFLFSLQADKAPQYGHLFARNEVRVSKTDGFLRVWLARQQPLWHETRVKSSVKNRW